MSDLPYSWRWALQSPAGLTVSLLRDAFGRELRYQRNAPAEATLQLEHEADDAFALFEQLEAGVPIVRAWRLEPQSDLSLRPVCRFASQVFGIEESAGEGMTITCKAPPARLEFLYTAETDDHPFEDAGEIGRQLVEDPGVQHTRLVVATVEATVQRDLTYENAQRLETLGELTDADQGFDYDVLPVAEGPTLGQLRIVRALGERRPAAVFGYGQGTVQNCLDARRRWLPPLNEVRAIGDDGVTQTASDPVSQATFDLWQGTVSVSDTVDASVLKARAQEQLSPGWRRYVEFDPDPFATDDGGRAITPQPWVDYGQGQGSPVGDTVPVVIRKGAWRSQGESRIDALTIALSDDGLEDSHEIAIMEAD